MYSYWRGLALLCGLIPPIGLIVMLVNIKRTDGWSWALFAAWIAVLPIRFIAVTIAGETCAVCGVQRMGILYAGAALQAALPFALWWYIHKKDAARRTAERLRKVAMRG